MAIGAVGAWFDSRWAHTNLFPRLLSGERCLSNSSILDLFRRHMAAFVYILYSKKLDRFYTGVTTLDVGEHRLGWDRALNTTVIPLPILWLNAIPVAKIGTAPFLPQRPREFTQRCPKGHKGLFLLTLRSFAKPLRVALRFIFR